MKPQSAEMFCCAPPLQVEIQVPEQTTKHIGEHEVWGAEETGLYTTVNAYGDRNVSQYGIG